MSLIHNPLDWDNSLFTQIVDNNNTYTTSMLFGKKPKLIYQSEIFNSSNIEFLEGDLSKNWECLGLSLCDLDNFNFKNAEIFLKYAYSILDEIKIFSLKYTIEKLVKSIHPLKYLDLGYDTSFSEPILPYSIFLTFPYYNEKNSTKRFLESLIHEALHLQLSLIERKILLVDQNLDLKDCYSPWKGEGRTTQGLLHAIYVFSNIQALWEKFIDYDNDAYAKKRVEEIKLQIYKSQHIFNSSALTENGSILMQKCFNYSLKNHFL